MKTKGLNNVVNTTSALNAGPIEGTEYNEYQRICENMLAITEWGEEHNLIIGMRLFREDIPDYEGESFYDTVESLVLHGEFEYKGCTVFVNYYEDPDCLTVSTPIGRHLFIPIEEWEEKLDPSYWRDYQENDNPKEYQLRKRNTRK